MKVLILGLNYAPELVGTGVYTTGMAEALAQAGHSVAVVAGRPHYPHWRILDAMPAFAFAHAHENGVQVTRVPLYVPRMPSGGRRVLQQLSFGIMALGPILSRAMTMKPDVVIAIAPALLAAPLARAAARLWGARTWLHLQDLEVDAAIGTGLIKEAGLWARWAVRLERALLAGFDRVSTISPEMRQRLLEKGVERGKLVVAPNWADPAVHSLDHLSPLRAQWGITAPHIALYAGALGHKQGVGIILDAAKRLTERRDLLFVICSQGLVFDALREKVRGLPNLLLMPTQPAEQLNALLNLASVHLLPQIAGAADCVLPSKLANMLASGRPVVATSAPNTGVAREVEGSGIVVPPGDAPAFASAILRFIDDRALHERFSRAAQARAEAGWRRDAVLGSFIAEVERMHAEEHAGARVPVRRASSR